MAQLVPDEPGHDEKGFVWQFDDHPVQEPEDRRGASLN
jgi:hypothetical protein